MPSSSFLNTSYFLSITWLSVCYSCDFISIELSFDIVLFLLLLSVRNYLTDQCNYYKVYRDK